MASCWSQQILVRFIILDQHLKLNAIDKKTAFVSPKRGLFTFEILISSPFKYALCINN